MWHNLQYLALSLFLCIFIQCPWYRQLEPLWIQVERIFSVSDFREINIGVCTLPEYILLLKIPTLRVYSEICNKPSEYLWWMRRCRKWMVFYHQLCVTGSCSFFRFKKAKDSRRTTIFGDGCLTVPQKICDNKESRQRPDHSSKMSGLEFRR